MKKIFAAAILLCSAAIFCAGQKSTVAAKPKKQPVKPTPTKTAPAVKPSTAKEITEISAADWKILTDALTAENWDTAAALAARLVSRLKTDNEAKQLAQLRYFYLYSLAGRISQSAAAKDLNAEKAARDELTKTVVEFTGEEFVLPPRPFRADCRNVLNFVCPIAGNEKAFRAAATGKDATEILSFDYVLFDRKIDVRKYAENNVFLGGVLRRAEFNEDRTKPWIMRLTFVGGFARIIL